MLPKRPGASAQTILLLTLAVSGGIPGLAQNRGTVVFRAEPARSTAGLRDAVEVTYTLVDVPKLASLSLQPSPDFTVLPGEVNRQSTNTDLTPQGPVQSTTLSRTYLLRATHTGKLAVPVAIARTADGRVYRSNAPEVTVVPGSAPRPRTPSAGSASADPFGSNGAVLPDPLAGLPQGLLPPGFDPWERVVPNPKDAGGGLPRRSDLSRRLFLEILPEKRTAWVGEPVTVRYRLAGSVDASGSLTKLPTPDGFWVQDLETAQSAPTDTSIGGQWFQALLLKRSAFIPQRAGTLVIDPAEMNATTDVAGPDGMPERVQVYLASKPVSITVRPLPAGAPASFNGAVGRFSVTAQLDHLRIGSDGTAQLAVTVQGGGNLTQIEAPSVSFPEGLSAEEPQIQDVLRPESATLAGSRRFTYLLTPDRAGTYDLPPISFSFFNPQTGAYQTLRTAPLQLQVLEGAQPSAPDAGTPSPAPARWGWWIAGSALALLALIGLLLRRKRPVPHKPAVSPNRPRQTPAAQAPLPTPVSHPAVPPASEPMPATLQALLPQLRRGLDGLLGAGASDLPGDQLQRRLEAAGWTPEAAGAVPHLLQALEAALYGGRQPADAADLLHQGQDLWRRLHSHPPGSRA